MKAIAAALACAALTSGCALELVPNAKELAAFPGSGSGMIAMTFDGSDLGCYTGSTTFMRSGGDKEYITVMSQNDMAGAAIVKPGSYSLLTAGCSGGDFTYTLPNVYMWFAPFEVNAGEIVYPGAFIPKAIDVATFRTDGDRAMTALLTLGLSLFVETETNQQQFPVYIFENRLNADRPVFERDLGGLAGKMVVRQPMQILSPEAFVRAYKRAYAPNADGTAVTEEQGRERLSKEIETAIKESLDRLMPPPAATVTAPGAAVPAPPVLVTPAPQQ